MGGAARHPAVRSARRGRRQGRHRHGADRGPAVHRGHALDDLLAQVGPGDYLAIQAFVDPGSPQVAAIERARVALRDWLRGDHGGPRPAFLHSTGQLHKGGPATGVFVQVVGDDPDDVPIPAAAYGFSTSSTPRPTATSSPCSSAAAGPAG